VRPAAAPAAITAGLGALAREMRARGAPVGVGELLAAHRALAAVDPSSAAEARLALRATLCASRADLAAFDAAFAACFAGGGFEPAPPPLDPVASLALPRVAVPGGPPLAPDEVTGEVRPAAWSEIELLRERDFADYSAAERRLAQALVRRLARRGPTRRSRRLVPVRRRGEHPDLRATLRASLRHAGEPVERRYRATAERDRPLVMVIDISGSMEPYARMLLQYVQACVAARRRVEAFAFGTRLTRITDELRGRDPDRALGRAAAAVADWSGGTRIGAALADLNRVHGRRVGRGSIVAILSDGWDRGDPELLAREIERVRRCAHRLVWLNPLKARPGYEPLTRGMRAALPHVDAFLAGNSLASLAELARLMDEGFEAGRGR
jgi:uncharacterized protein with von Willebrand factor type A (vWA) domain